MSDLKEDRKIYDVVSDQPVARFFYKGKRDQPIRRTILIIEDKPDMLIGYEMRAGNTVISKVKDAPVKSYKKDRISKYGDRVKLRRSKIAQTKQLTDSTLERYNIMNLLTVGA